MERKCENCLTYELCKELIATINGNMGFDLFGPDPMKTVDISGCFVQKDEKK